MRLYRECDTSGPSTQLSYELLCQSCFPIAAIAFQVKQGQKDVIAAVRNIVTCHTIRTRKADTGRQPSVHMNPPVDFFCGDQVYSPTDEDAGRNPEVQQVVNEDHYNSVAGEQNSYVQRSKLLESDR